MISLRDPERQPETNLHKKGHDAVESQRVRIRTKQLGILRAIQVREDDPGVRLYRIGAILVTVNAHQLRILRDHADVADAAEPRESVPSLSESVPLIGTPTKWQSGFTGGGGVTIAVLDTGVLSSHPFLAGKVTHEACFSGTGSEDIASVCPRQEMWHYLRMPYESLEARGHDICQGYGGLVFFHSCTPDTPGASCGSYNCPRNPSTDRHCQVQCTVINGEPGSGDPFGTQYLLYPGPYGNERKYSTGSGEPACTEPGRGGCGEWPSAPVLLVQNIMIGPAAFLSTTDGTYGIATGSSMAAPHVAGAVALHRQAQPQLSF